MRENSIRKQGDNTQSCRKIPFGYIYAIFAFVLSVLNVFRVYPFIGLADGFTRWGMEDELSKYGSILQKTVLSSAIPVLELITFKISGSFGFFTFIQTLFFYFGIGLLAYYLQDKKAILLYRNKVPTWIIISILLLLFPTIGLFPLLLTDSAFCFMTLVVMAFLFYKYFFEQNSMPTKRVIWLGVCVNCIFMVYLRPNTVVVIAGMIVFLLIYKRTRKTILVLSLLIPLILGCNINSAFLKNHYSGENLGFMWELTKIAKTTQDQKLITEMNQYGNTEVAISRYNDDYSNDIFWDNDPPYPVFNICDKSNSIAIKRLYLQTAFHYPAAFWKNKLHFASRVLGISEPLIGAERGIHNVDVYTMKYGAMQTVENEKIREEFISTTNIFSFLTRRPFAMFLLVTILLLIKFFQTKEVPNKELFPYFISIFYYGAFIINTQAHEFRYYAPAFFILIILMFSLIFDILSKIIIGRRNPSDRKRVKNR